MYLEYPRDRQGGVVIFSDGYSPFFPKIHNYGIWRKKANRLRNRLRKLQGERNRLMQKHLSPR